MFLSPSSMHKELMNRPVRCKGNPYVARSSTTRKIAPAEAPGSSMYGNA